jgi:hypothetical protein
MATSAQTVQYQIVPGGRVLGNDLAPPRLRYILYIPAVLTMTGVVSWIMGDESGMVLGAGMATAVALYTMWEWLIRRGPLRFSMLMALALLLGYGLGTLNTWFTLPRGSLSLADFMGQSQAILTRGVGAVLIAAASLYFLGEMFEKPVFGRDFRFCLDDRTRALTYVGAIAILGGYFTHSLTFGGVSSAGGHESIAGAFLIWLFAPLAALATAGFLSARTRKDKLLGGLSSLILLLIFSVLGRRVLIYTTVEIVFTLGLIGYQWRGKIVRKILLLLVLGTIIVGAALTFMLLRVAGSISPRKNPSAGQRFKIVGSMVQKGGAYELATAKTQENAQTRTFILAFFANVLDASSRETLAMGKDALGYLQMAIPSVIYPDKDLRFSEEDLVDRQFGFSYGDEANSIVTAGATDFGLFGVIVYPILMVIVVRLVYDLIARFFSVVPLLFATLSFVFLLLQSEMTLNGYFNTLRNTFLFTLILAVFLSMTRIKVSSDGV